MVVLLLQVLFVQVTIAILPFLVKSETRSTQLTLCTRLLAHVYLVRCYHVPTQSRTLWMHSQVM